MDTKKKEFKSNDNFDCTHNPFQKCIQTHTHTQSQSNLNNHECQDELRKASEAISSPFAAAAQEEEPALELLSSTIGGTATRSKISLWFRIQEEIKNTCNDDDDVIII